MTRDLAAAGGVILSLLFVGFEIRQNTAAVRAASLQALAEMSQANTLAIAENPELAVASFVAVLTPDSLDPVQQGTMNGLAESMVRVVETRFRMMQMGILDEEELFISGGGTVFYRTGWFRGWWERVGRDGQPRDFADWWDMNIQSLPEWTPPIADTN